MEVAILGNSNTVVMLVSMVADMASRTSKIKRWNKLSRAA
jgi:Cys-tRNA synthase (O-phospho-L-seryl-tRNA:Cys-tRNA synthase)